MIVGLQRFILLLPLTCGATLLHAQESGPFTAASRALPQNLSPLGMFIDADFVVKTVIVGLALASLITWTVLVAKSMELMAMLRRQRRVLACVADARTLPEAEASCLHAGLNSELLEAARVEWNLSADALHDGEGLKERIVSRMERLQAAASRKMKLGTGLLATIGATAPFVGLLGTVWGIMNSFIGISHAQTTNLAVVAPGIAEALLATAIGLVAAIPAVVIYNYFTRRIVVCRALLMDTMEAVLRLVSRDLSRNHIRASLCTREDGGESWQ